MSTNLDLREKAISDITRAATHFVQDLEAIKPDKFNVGVGGASRSPADLAFECAFIHRRIGTRLAGQDPGPIDMSAGWMRAEEGFTTPEAALSNFKASTDELIASVNGIPDTDLEKLVGPEGNQMPAVFLAMFAAHHTNYHDGQLNLMQAIHGDDDFHWA